MPFVGLSPVRLLHPSMAVLCHVNGKLQRAYCLSRPTGPTVERELYIVSVHELVPDVQIAERG